MSIKASIYHLTHYRYDRPVILGPQVIRLRPAPHSRTRVLAHSLKVAPARPLREPPAGPLRQLAVALRLPRAGDRAEDRGRPRRRHDRLQPLRLLRRGRGRALAVRLPRGPARRPRHLPRAEPVGPRLQAFLDAVPRERARTVDFVVALNAPRRAARSATSSAWSPACRRPRRRFERGTGSCRDSSWLLVQALRNLGLAARFVSGYLIQLKPDLVALDGPPGTDHDFTDLHAWAEVYLPGAGWIGLDPTSGLLTGESHIPLAATPHYRNAAPIAGSRASPRSTSASTCRSPRVAEHPRITKPFSDEAWAALDALGRKVDAALTAGDVRLTMGGEPTFVSIDDFESDGVEHRGGRPDQARPRRPADPPPARPLRARRLPALRPGQVVPGRDPAALDLLALLARATASRSGATRR